MSSTSPPQLHLSLPHQSFKRSFQQFGLDVESPGSSAGSSSSTVSSGSFTGASASGSSSSSQSSPASGVGHGNERNKRARSEGPDCQSDNEEQRGRLAQSGGFTALPPTLPQIRSLNATTYSSSISEGLSPLDEQSASTVDSRSAQPQPRPSAPHALRAGLSSSERQAIDTRSSLITTALDRSYFNLLDPRLSSPVPPSRMDEDSVMTDDGQDARRNNRLPSMQTRSPAEVHEESFRDTLERAQAFDRSIAPLRSDPSELVTSHEREHSFTTNNSFQDEFGSLRAEASSTSLDGSFRSEIRPDTSGSFPDELHSFESAPHTRFPRTSGLRPASRYSQAAAMYRPQSPPSPPPLLQRLSFPRASFHVESETEMHFNRMNDRSQGMRRPARPPSPEIPTFNQGPDQDARHVHSRLREHTEALLDDIDTQQMFPLSLSLGDIVGLLDVDDDDDAPESEMRTSGRSGRMIRAEHSSATMDSIPPIRPLQRNHLIPHWSREDALDSNRGATPSSFPSRSGASQMESATPSSTLHNWDNSHSSLAPRPFMRLNRSYDTRISVPTDSVGAPQESRPSLPTIRAVIHGTEAESRSGAIRANARRFNDIEIGGPRGIAEEVERDLSDMGGYFSERSREAERLRLTAGRTPISSQLDTPSFPMPTIGDIIFGPRIEGTDQRSGGLMEDESFRQTHNSLLSSLRQQLHAEQNQPSRQREPPPSGRPSLSQLREMNRLPIRTRSVVDRSGSFERHSYHEHSTRSAFPSPDRRSFTSTAPGIASSSEAAAYFASGRAYPTPSGAAAPRLIRRSIESHREAPGAPRREYSGELHAMFASSEQPERMSDIPRLPTPEFRRSSASSELLNVMYPGRFSATFDNSEEADIERVISRPSRAAANDSAAASDVLRHHSWSSRREEPVHAARMGQRTERGPPSLPPLRFGQTFVPIRRDDGEAGRSGVETNLELPWRSQPSRIEQPVSGGLMADARRSMTSHFHSLPLRNSARQLGDRNADVAIQRARLLRSVESRLQPEDQDSGPGQADGRTQGFQRAMHVLRSDGLTSTRQHQFQSAFERQQQRASTVMPPRENHSHWGEIRGDNIDRRHFNLLSRRRGSALFADPPDNPDNAPPNRGSGSATNAHSMNHQGPPSPMSEFFSRFSSRPRVRNRSWAMRQGEDVSANGSFGFRLFGRRRSAASFGAGDFVRDEDFDESYESLLALATTLGDAKPRATPAHHLAALPTAFYKDWQTPDSDSRCPICLDDYKSLDPVLKAEPCDHWCHKECLEQWLHSARTCPVCRGKISPKKRPVSPQPVAGPSNANRSNEDDEDSDNSSPSPIEPAILAAFSASYSREII